MAATHLRQIRRFPPLSRCQRRRAVGPAGGPAGPVILLHDPNGGRHSHLCVSM